MKRISNAFRKVISIRFTKSIIAVVIVMTVVIMFSIRYNIVINHDGSLPINGVIIKLGQIPTKNDEIFVFNVRNNAHFQSKNIKFIKYIGGFAGNQIKIREREVYVADRPIGYAKTQSKKGIPLNITEETVIPEHKFFAYTPHKDSFDSRYQEIGLIDEKDIIGTAVLTF